MDFSKVQRNLEKLGYIVSCFDKKEDAVQYLDFKINHQTVGFGGSMSLEEMGLYDILSSHNEVYWHHRIPEGKTSREIRLTANKASIYLSSINGLSETGEIINIDGTGNRVASIFYGHDIVYLIVGKNKIESNYDKALYRARNIASPLNAKRLKVNTPCAIKADRCYDCRSPERICRGLSVLWQRPIDSIIEIILINEDLGY